MNMVEIPRTVYTHTHTLSIYTGWGFSSAFFFHRQCKESQRSFCSFENPPDNVGSWLLAWLDLKDKKKKRKEKTQMYPVPSPVLHTLHTQHSGPDFLQYPSEAALLFVAFRSGWRIVIFGRER